MPPEVMLPPWAGERPAMPVTVAERNLEPTQIFATVSPSVYLVVAGPSREAVSRGLGAAGSAVAISSRFALTNCHIVKNSSYVVILDE